MVVQRKYLGISLSTELKDLYNKDSKKTKKERHAMFLEPNNFYYENGHTIKSGPQSWWDANESSYAILYKNIKKILKFMWKH